MGLFDWLTPPPPRDDRQSPAALRKQILALERPTAPFRIRDGGPEGVDLVAEWRIVDAKWREVFAAAGIKRVFKVLMKIDAARGEVRAADQAWSVEWRAGVPDLSVQASGFRGQSWEMSYETVYAFREDLSFGRIYEYRFNTGEIKGPLIKAVREAGWRWRGLAFSRL